MDSMEKIKGMVSKNEPSEIPIIPFMSIWAANFYGIEYDKIIKNPRYIAHAHIKAFETIGYDALFTYCDIVYFAEAFGCRIKVTSLGAVVESSLEINNLTDIDRLKKLDVRNDARLPIILEATDRVARYAKGNIPVIGIVEGPLTTASRLVGTEKLMRKIIKDREFVEMISRKITETSIEFGKALIKHGANVILIADPVCSSNLISPKAFKELVFPLLCDLVKGLNVISILHVCGETEGILKLMSKTGVSIISIDQCVDLRLARERIGWDVCLGGNINPMTLLLGQKSDVEKETERCLCQGGNRKFILIPGCTVPPNTPVENLRAMVHRARVKSRE
jgi:MtaA/CmuA family methyltransferase